MGDDVDHVLLTRFNLPSNGAESFIRDQEGWLRDRVELFERYCVPSVMQQTIQDFHWIVYLDPESPAWLKDLLEESRRHGVLTPIFRTSVHRENLMSDLRAVTGAHRRDLLTTNLDNDDGLATEFVERIRRIDVDDRPTAIYLCDGLIKRGTSLFRHKDRHNAFCSVRESWEDGLTCWADWHNLLGKRMPIVEVDGEPAWLQVVHNHNVSNRVRGRRVAAQAHAKTFVGLLDDVVDPSVVDMVTDTTLLRPTRYIREAGRALMKRAVVSTMGKDGLDRLKYIRASRRQ